MDELTQIALVGTSRVGQAEFATTPVTVLVDDVAAGSPERALLLRAGAEAIYRLAGMRSVEAPEPPEVASEETLPVCSPRAAALIRELIETRRDDLMREATDRLLRLGQRLPPVMLPLALERKFDLRVLGERGRWLAQFSETGRSMLHGEWLERGPLPENAETVWREGDTRQRLDLLRVARRCDPAMARDWLAAAWKRESAAFRRDAVQSLEVGLSHEDEPLLDAALDDRSTDVGATAARLLSQLPGSAFVQRMTSRADEFLDYGPAEPRLHISLPAELPTDWRRDCIREDSPPCPMKRIAEGQVRLGGKRGWWLEQLLAIVPPDHWTSRFGVSAAQLFEDAEGQEMGNVLLFGLNRSTVRHRSATWANVWWQQLLEKTEDFESHLWQIPLDSYQPFMNQVDAIRLTTAALAHAPLDDPRWGRVLKALSRPWPTEFATLYLDAIERVGSQAKVDRVGNRSWFLNLDESALALPPECLDRAAQEWAYLEPDDPSLEPLHRRQWDRAIPGFKETVRLRRRIYEEIV